MSRSRRPRASELEQAASEEAELEASLTKLSRLKRQYRMVERNRKQYHEEASLVLNKQRKMLVDLEDEREKLQEKIKIATAPKNKLTDLKTKRSMSAILDKQEYYERLIEEEKDQIKDLDEKIQKASKMLRDTRKTVPSTKSLEEKIETEKSTNVLLENRIQQATIRLNAILAENGKLRELIDNLLKKREKHYLQVKRLENFLTKTSKKKNEVMNQVTRAYAEREEAQAKMRTLKERFHRDSSKYSNEMKKIQRAIDFHTNLRLFVNTIHISDDEQVDRKKLQAENAQDVGIDMTVEKYKQSIAHLENESENVSITNVLSNYVQMENYSYTLFSYISELSNEVTSLQNDCNKLQLETEVVKSKRAQAEAENLAALKKVKEELEELKEEMRSYENEEREAKACLIEMIAATAELISMLECDSKSVQDLVGTTEISSSNLPLFLSIIEQKIQEIAEMRDSMADSSNLNILSIRQKMRRPSNFDQLATDEENIDQVHTPAFLIKSKSIIPAIVTHTNEDEISKPQSHFDVLDSLNLEWEDDMKKGESAFL